MSKRVREETALEELQKKQRRGVVDESEFDGLCVAKRVDDARAWWKRYGESRWNVVCPSSGRPLPHSAVILGDLPLLQEMYEDIPDVFLDGNAIQYETILHTAIKNNATLAVIQFLCDTCFWEDVTNDVDSGGRSALIVALNSFSEKDPRLDLLVEYYRKHSPTLINNNPSNVYYETPLEHARSLFPPESEIVKKLESIAAQSPMSPPSSPTE